MLIAATIEKWGSGLKRIAEDCAESGVKVKYEFLKTGYHIVFYRKENETGKGLRSDSVEKVGEKVGEKVTEKITENQKIILLEMDKNKYISAVELAKIVGISERKIEVNIKKLKTSGLIKRIGPDKGGYWKT